MPNGTYGGVRGWGREAPAYSIWIISNLVDKVAFLPRESWPDFSSGEPDHDSNPLSSLATAGLRIGMAKAGQIHSPNPNSLFSLTAYSRERLPGEMKTPNSFSI
jgi:hypothetical protein